MRHDQFIGQVQHRARLGSRGEAERASRVVLETLGERLTPGQADNVAAQLPTEIGHHLRATAPVVDPMGLPSFVDRLAEREGVDRPEAVFHARCVIEVVDEATSGGLIAKVRDQLPEEYDRLFEAGSRGHMPGAGRA